MKASRKKAATPSPGIGPPPWPTPAEVARAKRRSDAVVALEEAAQSFLEGPLAVDRTDMDIDAQVRYIAITLLRGVRAATLMNTAGPLPASSPVLLGATYEVFARAHLECGRRIDLDTVAWTVELTRSERKALLNVYKQQEDTRSHVAQMEIATAELATRTRVLTAVRFALNHAGISDSVRKDAILAAQRSVLEQQDLVLKMEFEWRQRTGAVG